MTEHLARTAVGGGGHQGATVITALTQGHIDGNLSDHRHAEALRLDRAPALAEDRDRRSGGRIGEIGHILDQAEDRGGRLLEHRGGPPGVDQRDFLRRGDDDHPVELHLLDQGQLNVAGARRHVHHQHIQGGLLRSPGHLMHHLAHRRGGHGPAPDHRRTLVDHEADGHDLDPPGLQGNQLLLWMKLRIAVGPQHPWCRRPIDIGVQQADSQAKRREADRQADRDGGLAHPALAAGNSNHPTDIRWPRRADRRRRRRLRICGQFNALAHPGDPLRRRWRRPIASGVGQHHLGLLHPRRLAQGRFGSGPHGLIKLEHPGWRFHHEAGPAIAHRQPLNQPRADQPLPAPGVEHPVQKRQQGVAVRQA